MNAKELQEKYAADASIAKGDQGNKPKVTGAMPIGYLEHVRRQALKLTEMVGIHNGIHYLKVALEKFPEVLEEEVKRLEKGKA